MLGSSRRIFWYWLLLLLPTLAVGAGALLLLRREQDHFASRAASAEQARRAALEARTRLVAENIELLIGDVQDGLLDALGRVPAEDLSTFIELWPKSQPLVRVAFVATSAGQLLKPVGDETGDDRNGFLRRFKSSFAQSPPWNEQGKEELLYQRTQDLRKDSEAAENSNQAAQALNVARAQMARREVKALSKIAPPTSSPRLATKEITMEHPESPDPLSENQVPALGATARRGWTARESGGRLHVIGWIQPDDGGDVRGIELETTALISRLGSGLPAELGAGQGLALHDEKQQIIHQVGWIPGRPVEPVAHAALSAASFPGWEVVGFLEAPSDRDEKGGGFFIVGALLVGTFVIAILSGGSLLLLQARRSEEEARQKTSFVANVSHEFKTPLTSIRLYSELLEQGRVRGEKQAEYLRTIGRETQRLARLVNNALDFSRLEQGRKKYHLEQIDLQAELIRILDTLQPRLSELQFEIHLEMPPETVLIKTDRDAVEQIVLNLVDNACKYGAAGREMTVSLALPTPGTAVIRIADRGSGVPSEHRERIFEKFHRVDETLTAEKTGAGLGLSIARQLARGLNGGLCYDAREKGGAVFVLTLPRS